MIKKRATDIVLLCEDKRHEQFARRFLLRRGVPGRRIRSLVAPPGSGDAKLWVRQCYPDEIRAYRTKSNSIHNILFVMTDVDNESVVKRFESLENACHDVRLDGLRSGERIVLALPKWAIETWILSLTGNPMAESDRIQPAHKQKADPKWKEAAQLLADQCSAANTLSDFFPLSLRTACKSYSCVREWI